MGNRFPHWLIYQSRHKPERTALLWEDNHWNYGEFGREVRQCAAWLENHGVRQGTHTGILSGNDPIQVILYHALPLVGAVAVPLNHRLSAAEIRRQLEYADVEICFIHDDLAGRLEPPDIGAQLLHFSDIQYKEMSPVSDERDLPDPDSTAAIFHTSGTTGTPRGVELTYRNMVISALASALNLGIHSSDGWLACLPLDHIGGYSILTRSAMNGTAVVLQSGFDERRVMESLRKDGITLLSLVPTMLQRLFDAGLDDAHSLRAILLGGGPAPGETLSRAASLDLPLLTTYGLTETCSQIATVPVNQAGTHLDTAGRPLAMAEIRIVDESGSICEPGSSGEIQVRSPAVMRGYWKAPGLTKQVFTEGWLRTGDYGWLDREGYLHMDLRREDRIVTGGENVNPREVEKVLRGHPEIEDACVFGLPHPEWGEEVCAAVVLTAGREAVPDTLCRERFFGLASYKQPRRYFLMERLPRTATGKVRRKEVRELFGGGGGGGRGGGGGSIVGGGDGSGAAGG